MLLRGAPEAAQAVFDELRVELCVGQSLDLVGTATARTDAASARRIATYKSGKYTVERPLHLGAALAGRYAELADPLSAVGLPMGEAFQLRDDVLGAFGESAVTGKPVGDDLREGKPTPLVAIATARAADGDRELLAQLGSSDLTGADVADAAGAVRANRRARRRRGRDRAAGRGGPHCARRRTDHGDGARLARRARRVRRVAGLLSVVATEPAISVASLSKSYGRTRAVDDLDFTVGARRGVRAARSQRRGQDHDRRDPRGLPHAPTRARRASSDSIPCATAASSGPQIGVMLQSGGLYPGLRPLELLKLFAAYYEPAESPELLLEIVGLRERRCTRRCGGCRAGRPSDCRSRARSSAGPASCSSTSRPPAWTRTRGRRRGTSCATCASAASPCCSRRTRWTRRRCCATASRSSPAGGSPRSARRRS